MLILYGSETGTAQDVAEGIWRTSKRYGFTGTVQPMDDYDISKLIYEPLIVFVCSTTGQGDPPENMRNFWRFLLRKSLPKNSLSNSWVAVLGLGDSSYAKFNFSAKKLSKRLVSLGAKLLIDTGLCDDQHDLGLYAELIPWTEKLWNTLQPLYPHLKLIKESGDSSLLLKWEAVPRDGNPEELSFLPGEPNERYWCEVSNNVRITDKNHFQDVRLITFVPDNESIQYSPGSVAYIRPTNQQSSVEKLISIIGEQCPKVFDLKSINLPLPEMLEGKILSLKDVATVYWDINAVPRRYVFEVLAKITTSELEKDKLEEFLMPSGLDEMYSYCNRPRRTTLEVLQDFPVAASNLQLDHLFEIFQPIRARAYSIASSIEYDGPVIKLLVAIVQYKTRLSVPRQGLASTWLSTVTGRVCVAVKPPSLKFPERGSVIMVGPGTGIAPFRSFISKRVAQVHHGEGDIPKEWLVVIFGSRYKNADFHFGNEFEKWEKTNDITLITAFSRDQPEKIYVQHKIVSEGPFLFQRIHSDDCFIFVAGSSNNMPIAVKDAFMDIIATEGGFTKEEAKTYIGRMEASGRYQEET